MSVSKLLNEGEQVVVLTRTHVKVLFTAFVVLLLTAFATAFLAAQIAGRVDGAPWRAALWIALGVVALVVLLRWVLAPFVRWYTSTYVFTDRRFIQRSGFIAKEGRTVPLNRISGVDFEMGVVDRLFGSGTLIVSDASENGRVPLKDIPHVERVSKLVAEQLHRIASGRAAVFPADDGT